MLVTYKGVINLKNLNVRLLGSMLSIMLIFTGCSSTETTTSETNNSETTTTNENNTIEDVQGNSTVTNIDESDYQLIEVEGGDLSGDREPNSKVDIGYGDRDYYAYTNEYGQVFYVEADEIINQDDDTEDVTSEGRYYSDEAKVPGTEADDMDEGHLIADSLGGVSNAYNITPQYYTVNRGQDDGDMRPIEEQIQDNGATDLTVIVTYPNTDTQTPSSYEYQFTSQGKEYDYIVYNHESEDTEQSTNDVVSNTADEVVPNTDTASGDKSASEWLSLVDSNGNGQVTISEAKAYGISMPVLKSELPNLYSVMHDNDGDGAVGE